MTPTPSYVPAEPRILPKSQFQYLIDILHAQEYQVLGPVVRNDAITWETIQNTEDLPIGWRDHQQPGQYRLEHTEGSDVFGIVHGPESLKRQTFAPREQLLTIERKKPGFMVSSTPPPSPPTAVIGVRACDLAGLAIQDHIFLNEQFPDPFYEARRKNLFLAAVNCTRAHDTCFCASMQTGPRAHIGYDLVLTESDSEFSIQAGTPEGQAILNALALSPASAEHLKEDDRRINVCAASQTRSIPQQQLPQALYDAHDHPRWDDVASRCLACTNCTMVCPTCFCHTVEETPDLSLQRSEHVRVWDSCFTSNHGYIHGKNFRPTIKDRYRMWLTHKVGSWIDQFGMSGCVGCGRCITWCPVGIDLTEELQILLTPEKNS